MNTLIARNATHDDFEEKWELFWQWYQERNSVNVEDFKAVVKMGFWAGWLQRRQFERGLPTVYLKGLRPS